MSVMAGKSSNVAGLMVNIGLASIRCSSDFSIPRLPLEFNRPRGNPAG
jgi:hypothetical protein